MKTKHSRSSAQWELIGSPQGGAVASQAIANHPNGSIVFIGTAIGLFRTILANSSSNPEWVRLPSAPLGIISLVVSPEFEVDQTVIAGTDSGIFVSRDAGNSWYPAEVPLSRSMVLSIVFSPHYQMDGIVFAGTLEDGIWVSNSRGKSWHSSSFGLLDATIYCLAVSPDFSTDGTLFAGTDTALYFSYNQARAWKQLPFPEEQAPILSLAASANFNTDQTIFAGTEQNGILRSTDAGNTWTALNLPAVSASALLMRANNQLLAATENGILISNDLGESWANESNLPDPINLAQSSDLLLAGSASEGLWVQTAKSAWGPVSMPPVHSVLGLECSAQFRKDRLAFIYGVQEGVWRTYDGGRSWDFLIEPLPTLDIQSLALGENVNNAQVLAAAAPEGLLISTNSGDKWDVTVAEPAEFTAFSPNGRLLAASFPGEGIRVSADLGSTWDEVPGPWNTGAKVLALAINDDAHLYIATLEGVANHVHIRHGKSGELVEVLDQPAESQTYVSFWIPQEKVVNRPWFAAFDNNVWRFSARSGSIYTLSSELPVEARGEHILALSGYRSGDHLAVIACTGQRIFHSTDLRAWHELEYFGNDPLIALELSTDFEHDHTVYALHLGGALWKGILPID